MIANFFQPMKPKHLLIFVLSVIFLVLEFNKGFSQVFISGYMANPNGSDSSFEYVQLISTQDIDFSVTPYSVVWSNNGTATMGSR